MGSGNSKKSHSAGASADDLMAANGHSRERRRSHVDTNPPPKSDILVPCRTCERRFASDRIEKHSEVSFAAFYLSVHVRVLVEKPREEFVVASMGHRQLLP